MELKHLRSFVTVAQEQSFTRAALRLHIAQPPLSQRIRQLEEELGAQLFLRSTRKVELSAAGQAYYAAVAPLLGQLDQAAEACRRAARGESGILRVGYSGRASQRLLPRLMMEFRRRFPDVVLDLVGPHPTGTLRARLLERQLDLALCFLPIADKEIRTHGMAVTEFSLVLPATHRLAARNRVDLSELAHEPFVGYPSNQGFHLRRAMDDECLRAGFDPNVVRESETSQVLLCLVAAGTGVSIVPSELQQQEPIAGIVFKSLGPKACRLHHGLAWLDGNHNPALRNLLSLEFLQGAGDRPAGG